MIDLAPMQDSSLLCALQQGCLASFTAGACIAEPSMCSCVWTRAVCVVGNTLPSVVVVFLRPYSNAIQQALQPVYQQPVQLKLMLLLLPSGSHLQISSCLP